MFRARFARNFLTPPKQRTQGMPGARSTRSLACEIESTRVSHHGHTGITRHSPRNGFNAYNALSPVTGLFCHRRRRNCFRRLDPSVGRSGPHALAVRRIAPSSLAPPASTASRPAFRDDREPPLCVGRDQIAIVLIWSRRQTKFWNSENGTGATGSGLILLCHGRVHPGQCIHDLVPDASPPPTNVRGGRSRPASCRCRLSY